VSFLAFRWNQYQLDFQWRYRVLPIPFCSFLFHLVLYPDRNYIAGLGKKAAHLRISVFFLYSVVGLQTGGNPAVASFMVSGSRSSIIFYQVEATLWILAWDSYFRPFATYLSSVTFSVCRYFCVLGKYERWISAACLERTPLIGAIKEACLAGGLGIVWYY